MRIVKLLADALGFILMVGMCWFILVLVAATAEAQYSRPPTEMKPMLDGGRLNLQDMERNNLLREQNRILRQQRDEIHRQEQARQNQQFYDQWFPVLSNKPQRQCVTVDGQVYCK